MKNETLTLSIVIPVYNEQRYLKACLEAIANQSVKADEVIVVNNNSTDRSEQIAKSFSFVKYAEEKPQHQVFAQAKGFSLASSDILGRIDADTVLPSDWVARVKQAFADEQIVAITGGPDPYDVPGKWLAIVLFHIYFGTAGLIAGHRMLYGANCAIRRSAWQKIKPKLMMQANIWEDYDLAFCLAPLGKIQYLRGIAAGVSFRAIHNDFATQSEYQLRAVRTFSRRTGWLRAASFALFWYTSLIIYPFTALDQWLLKHRSSS